jgi:hypothetical protein
VPTTVGAALMTEKPPFGYDKIDESRRKALTERLIERYPADCPIASGLW